MNALDVDTELCRMLVVWELDTGERSGDGQDLGLGALTVSRSEQARYRHGAACCG